MRCKNILKSIQQATLGPSREDHNPLPQWGFLSSDLASPISWTNSLGFLSKAERCLISMWYMPFFFVCFLLFKTFDPFYFTNMKSFCNMADLCCCTTETGASVVAQSVKNQPAGTSLVVQWLRLLTLSAGGPGSIPAQGTRSHVPPLKILHAATRAQCSQINKY